MSWYSPSNLWNDYKQYTPTGMLVNTLTHGAPAQTPQEQQMLAYNEQLKQQEAQAYAQQQHLAMMEAQAAAGQGPSLAGAQLGAGLEQINRGQSSMAAGVGGEGGVLARYAAMNSAANAGAGANQAGALARVDEIGQNRQLLGQTLGGMQTNSTNLYGADVSGYNTARQNDLKGQEDRDAITTNFVGSALKGASGGGAAKATG